MATLEITDKDIATVEQLHDRLLEKKDLPESLGFWARELIHKMYRAKEKDDND